MSNKRKIQRHLAAVAAASAEKQVLHTSCECGWQLPLQLNLRFQKAPAVDGSDVWVDLACPVCRHVYSMNFGKDGVPSVEETGQEDRIRCIM